MCVWGREMTVLNRVARESFIEVSEKVRNGQCKRRDLEDSVGYWRTSALLE